MSATVSNSAFSNSWRCWAFAGRYAQTVVSSDATSPTAVKSTNWLWHSKVPTVGTSSACQTSRLLAAGHGSQGRVPWHTIPSSIFGPITCRQSLIEAGIQRLRYPWRPGHRDIFTIFTHPHDRHMCPVLYPSARVDHDEASLAQGADLGVP